MAPIEVPPATFSLGRVVSRTFNVLGDNFVPYAAIAAVFVSPPMFISFLIARSFPVYVGVFSPLFARHYAYVLLNSFFSMLLTYFFRALLVQDVIASFIGDPAGLKESWSSVVRAFPKLLGVAIVVAAGVSVGFALLLVPGLVLYSMWSVAIPACVVERRNVSDALSRSAELTRGHRWSIFGLIFTFWMIAVVTGLAVRAVTGLGFLPGRHAAIPGNVDYWVAMAVVSAVIAPVYAAGIASIYYELRTIKEGVGSQQLAEVFA
jgi:hypothetical protein